MMKKAILSPDRKYRYVLDRIWDHFNGKSVLFICLNPSTADENADDRTSRRCINYAKCWGYGGMQMVNLFALRSKNPEDLRISDDPVGPDNDKYIKMLAKTADMIILGWGNDGTYLDRDMDCIALIRYPHSSRMTKNIPHYLQLTKDGNPQHPLYLKKILRPKPFKIGE